jgi:hypothetical protein
MSDLDKTILNTICFTHIWKISNPNSLFYKYCGVIGRFGSMSMELKQQTNYLGDVMVIMIAQSAVNFGFKSLSG